jgi:hypothetical protein
MAAARSPSGRADGHRSGHSRAQRREHDVPQTQGAGAGGGRDHRGEVGVSNRPARITQAEIERAIRAAKKAGLAEVEVRIGDEASIRIPLAPEKPIADAGEIIL